MSNMDYWNKMKAPPKEALKTIGGGRIKGMTDIKPQWRLKIMTDTFGPVGIGWSYQIDRVWREDGSNGQVFAFAAVSVKVNYEGIWSEWVPGIGGSMLVEKEKEGLYSSDEGYKMAVTDALSVAFKAFGVAADIYLGRWDGSKYKDEIDQTMQPVKSVDVLPFVAAIEVADSLDSLKACFADAWRAAGNDKAAQAEITAAKDKRKRELA